jgi:uncharacterized caspase-like protein
MRLLVAILALVILTAAAAHAEKRVALVIGNAAYKNAATLQNPRNDAQDVSAALQRLGFETIVGLDLDKAGMEDKSIAFARAARDADVALVYYSGHAIQFGGFNYLMPVDAALHDEADLRRLTRVDEIVADLKQAKNLRILVLDACRDNPLADELSRSMEANRGLTVDRGLARIIPPSGMIISYATQAGRTAADGRGRNSPYTMAFLKRLSRRASMSGVLSNFGEFADVFSQILGRRITYVPVTAEQAEQAMKARGMPDWLITHQLTAAQIAANGGLSTEKTEPVRNIVHRAPITTKQFVEDHKQVFS